MNSVLLAIDIILAVFLTILVLLQRSEGGALGALGGGSGNSLFTIIFTSSFAIFILYEIC